MVLGTGVDRKAVPAPQNAAGMAGKAAEAVAGKTILSHPGPSCPCPVPSIAGVREVR